MLASEIIDVVRGDLQDSTIPYRWADSTMLSFLTTGQIQVVGMIHKAYVSTAPMLLVAGAKQSLPSGSFELMGGMRLMGTDGLTPGAVILISRREDLDRLDPGWYSALASPTPESYVYDPQRDPLSFWISPPPVLPLQIEMEISVSPPSVGSTTAVLSLSEAYRPALEIYLLYRCLNQERTYADAGRATALWTQFLTSIGMEAKADFAAAPPHHPAHAGV